MHHDAAPGFSRQCALSATPRYADETFFVRVACVFKQNLFKTILVHRCAKNRGSSTDAEQFFLLLLTRVISSIAMLSASLAALAFLNVSNVFSDDAILQRDATVRVWGWAGGGSTPLTVSSQWVDGSTYSGAADATGLWRISFPAAAVRSSPFDLTFSSTAPGAPNVTLARLLLGDVISCNGQSNVGAVQVSVMANASAIVADAARLGAGGLRIMQVSGNVQSSVPLAEWPTSGLVPWQPPLGPAGDNSSLLGFSAVCYIAGSVLFDEHLGGTVPVGLLHSSHGGTSIQAWQSSAAAVAECGDASNSWLTAALYNSNFAPLAVGPLALKAVYWYQGEQDCGIGATETFWRAQWWGCSVGALIRDWRARLADPSLFFVVQQLHAWLHTGDIGLATFRQAQLKALMLPRVALSTAFDGGDPAAAMAGQPGGTVHSHEKFIPGRRAALALAGALYGAPVLWRNPAYGEAVAHEASNGTHTALTVEVAMAPGTVSAAGLVLRGWQPESNSSHCPTERAVNASYCAWFEVQTNDAAATWHNASVALSADGQRVVLSVLAPQPGLAAVATRNGFGDWPVTTVYSAEGLPLMTWQKPINGGGM